MKFKKDKKIEIYKNTSQNSFMQDLLQVYFDELCKSVQIPKEYLETSKKK